MKTKIKKTVCIQMNNTAKSPAGYLEVYRIFIFFKLRPKIEIFHLDQGPDGKIFLILQIFQNPNFINYIKN